MFPLSQQMKCVINIMLSKMCEEGKIYNPSSKRCVSISGTAGKKLLKEQKETIVKASKDKEIINLRNKSPNKSRKAIRDAPVVINCEEGKIVKASKDKEINMRNKSRKAIRDAHAPVINCEEGKILQKVSAKTSHPSSSDNAEYISDEQLNRIKEHVLLEMKTEMTKMINEMWKSTWSKELRQEIKQTYATNLLEGKKIAFLDFTDTVLRKQIVEKNGSVVTGTTSDYDFLLYTKNATNVISEHLMHKNEFQQLYFPYLPQCSPRVKLNGVFVALQDGYRNEKIEKFVKKCGGIIVPSTFNNIGVFVMDNGFKLEDMVGANLKKNTLVLNANQFVGQYMLNCIGATGDNSINGKSVAFADFSDTNLKNSIITCSGIFVDLKEKLIPHYVIYKTNNELDGNFLVQKALRHGSHLISYDEFVEKFVLIH